MRGFPHGIASVPIDVTADRKRGARRGGRARDGARRYAGRGADAPERRGGAEQRSIVIRISARRRAGSRSRCISKGCSRGRMAGGNDVRISQGQYRENGRCLCFCSAARREPFASCSEGTCRRVNGGRKRRGDENPLNVVLPSEALPSVLCVKGMFARANGGGNGAGMRSCYAWYYQARRRRLCCASKGCSRGQIAGESGAGMNPLNVVLPSEALPCAVYRGAQTGEWREKGKAWEEIR